MSLNPPSTVLSEFVGNQKSDYLKAVEDGSGGDWTVVMGNEAGDLDSIASAIAFAWYIAHVDKVQSIPLSQTPRSDLHLRAENLYALSLAGIDTTALPILCIDDIRKSKPFPSHKFALVDHNRLQPRFSEDNPNARVIAIVDHHEDEGLYKDTANPRVIAVPTGSSTSLVARLFEQNCPDQIPPELATLLLTGILIDTGGLKVGGKAEEVDRAAAAFLFPRSLFTSEISALATTPLHDHPDIQTLFGTLHNKKTSVSHLNTRDLLRRDYKEYTMVPHWASDHQVLVGLASVPVGFKSWIPKDSSFWMSTEQWMADRNLAVLGILTSFHDENKLNKKGKPKHAREQMFVVRKGEVEGLAEKLFSGLETSEELKLKSRSLKKHYDVKKGSGFGDHVEFRVWKQKNVDATRKVTAPIIKAVLEGSNAPA
ncbi:DHH phosphoesterase [Abortiporus biennis]|nr:DHH phosphoesterase [Abortiporus biennis]